MLVVLLVLWLLVLGGGWVACGGWRVVRGVWCAMPARLGIVRAPPAPSGARPPLVGPFAECRLVWGVFGHPQPPVGIDRHWSVRMPAQFLLQPSWQLEVNVVRSASLVWPTYKKWAKVNKTLGLAQAT